MASFVPQPRSCSIVWPKYSSIWRLPTSRSPVAARSAIIPGMLSTIRRDSCSLSRRASSVRRRSAISCFNSSLAVASSIVRSATRSSRSFVSRFCALRMSACWRAIVAWFAASSKRSLSVSDGKSLLSDPTRIVPISPASPSLADETDTSRPGMDMPAGANNFTRPSARDKPIALLSSRAPQRPSSHAANRTISVDPPVSGSFTLRKTNARSSISSIASTKLLPIRSGSPLAHSAGRAMMPTTSFRQPRNRAASSRRDSSGASTLHLRRAARVLRSPLAKIRDELLRRHKKRVPVKDAADDDHRMRAHDVDHGIAAELVQAICADHRIVVTTPDVVDARLKLDHIVYRWPGLGEPIHAAHNAAERKSVCRVAARQLLEHGEHSFLIETAVPKVRVRVGAEFELPARLGSRRVDAGGCQTLQMVVTLARIDDVNRFVAAVEAVLDERQQHAIL